MPGTCELPSMATSAGRDGQAVVSSDVELLLHPELLSPDFMQLILSERNVRTGGCGGRDRLTELYLRHVMPLPQRTLPDSRWGRSVERSRGRPSPGGHSSSNDHNRKRPPIVFDGTSSHSGPLKVRKPEGSTAPTGIADRLKPPPAANLSNPIRKLSGNTSSSAVYHHRTPDPTHLKRDADSSGTPQSPEVKKKIQHVTWP